MPGDYFFLNYGVQDGNVMQGLFRVNKVTYQLEVYNGSEWVVANAEGDATATPLTTAQRMAYAPASGALIWDVEEEMLYVGNGVTLGGEPFGSAAVPMTSTARQAITPRSGALIWDTTLGALFVGDGITAGGINTSTNLVRGATNGVVIEDGIAKADVGTVEEVLTGNTTYDMVDADNLRGALSVGQAVDVSCSPTYRSGLNKMSTDGGTTWADYDQSEFMQAQLDGIPVQLKSTTATASGSWVALGFGTSFQANKFPKYAPGLKYLFVIDFKNVGTAIPSGSHTGLYSQNGYLSGLTYYAPETASQEVYTRLAVVFTNGASYFEIGKCTSSTVVEIKNWRQYEVTALTDDAIRYIASLPDPDAFFRATSVYSLRDKYLIKQDMVCPFIPTIGMPDNSDLTVAAGLSYKIKYTNNNTHTITADTIPTDGYGWDTHIQMFIKGTSAINFQKPLILMDALTPNAGHNLSVKWRNGDALVYVDDTNAGNIVVSISGTTTGTLNYFLQQDPGSGQDNYIIFAATTDNATCDAGTVSVAYNTDVLGNGTDKTTITGTYDVASEKIMNLQDLAVSGSAINGAGTLNLVDVALINTDLGAESSSTVVNMISVEIPAGSTVTRTAGTATYVDNLVLNGTCSTRLLVDTSCVIAGTGVLDGYLQLAKSTGSSIEVTGITIRNNSVFLTIYGDSVTFTNCNLYGTAAGGNYGAFIRIGNGTMRMIGCTITHVPEMTSAFYLSSDSGILYLEDCDFGPSLGFDCYYGTVHVNGTLHYMGLSGDNGGTVQWLVHDNATLDYYFPDAQITTKYATQARKGGIKLGKNVSIITISGTSCSIDQALVTYISNTGVLAAHNTSSSITIIGPVTEPWHATNITFASPLDASAASTIKLTGTTFVTTAKTFNASRIQLPAATTVSFQGNTNPADTKIFEAGLIVVGDNPASPSGSATIVNASGSSVTVSGIGTYIDKEGDNDFVANNTTNVVPVDASTTGAKYLGTVLSATTGDTGANRFAKIDSGAVAVVNEATSAVNKQIITHDYEPILGGTFSLTSATVNEATKTVAIQSGGTMSVVDVRGGKDSVIDLGGTHVAVSSGTTVSANGCTFTGGSAANGGGVFVNSNANMHLTDCIVTGNVAVSSGGGILVSGGSLVFENSVAIGNTGISDIFIFSGGVILSGSTITECGLAYASANLRGSNVISKCIARVRDNNPGYITIESGATVDLTGNSYAYPPINGGPAGLITFESGGATVLYGSSGGAVSSMYLDNVTNIASISNDGVVTRMSSGSFPVYGATTTVRNAVVKFAARTYVGGNSVMKLENVTLDGSGGGSQWWIVAGNGSLIEFSGSNTFNKTDFANPSSGTFNVTLLPNTVLDVRDRLTNYWQNEVIGANGTLTIGSGCTAIVANGTTVSIVGGTYSNAYVAIDGTVVTRE